MINGISGFNTNLAQSLQTNKHENNSAINTNSLKEISNNQAAQNDNHISSTTKELKDDEPIKFGGVFSLSGQTLKGEISTWGKLMGSDNSMSKKEINELKSFVNQTKALGFGRLYDEILGKQPTDVDAFAKKYTSSNLGLGFNSDEEGFGILDKAQSIDEFKDAWLDYSVRKYLGEREGVESITIGKDNIAILANKNKPPVEFKTLDGINYEDAESRAKFMGLIKAGMKNGAEFKDVVEKVISLYNTTDTQKLDENSTFTAITGKSTNSKTYDISKDEKFAYLQELLKLEQEKGIDVLRLMQKLEEKGEKMLDKRA
ncbi:hypothetical protein [Campylobacter majalis]|uniref:hypothetical protein n=1 Tax=Campylobacter majalis TaxID=2790656 RepID=UPI003D69C274